MSSLLWFHFGPQPASRISRTLPGSLIERIAGHHLRRVIRTVRQRNSGSCFHRLGSLGAGYFPSGRPLRCGALSRRVQLRRPGQRCAERSRVTWSHAPVKFASSAGLSDYPVGFCQRRAEFLRSGAAFAATAVLEWISHHGRTVAAKRPVVTRVRPQPGLLRLADPGASVCRIISSAKIRSPCFIFCKCVGDPT